MFSTPSNTVLEQRRKSSINQQSLQNIITVTHVISGKATAGAIEMFLIESVGLLLSMNYVCVIVHCIAVFSGLYNMYKT